MASKPTDEIVPLDGAEPPDNGFVAYYDADVAEIVDIVKASKDSSLVIAACVLSEETNTEESDERAKKLLKKVLQKELVDAASGAVRPRITRLANLVFVMEDGRLVFDSDDEPAFRPPSPDGSVISLQFAVSQELVKTAKEETNQQDIPRSVRLLEEVVGYGTTKEVESVCSISSLSKKVQEKLGDEKKKILDIFEEEAKGTTESQLRETKRELQERLDALQKEFEIESNAKEGAEKRLNDLDETFEQLLGTLNLDGDMDALIGDGDVNFDVIVKALEDRYELIASKEKAKNEAISKVNDFKEEIAQLEALLQNTKDDRDVQQTQIQERKDSIKECEIVLANAKQKLEKAKAELVKAEDEEASADQNRKKFNELRARELSVVREREDVREGELGKISNAGINITSLRNACKTYLESTQDLRRDQNNLTIKSNEVKSARQLRDHAKNVWDDKKSEESAAYSIYANTSAKVKDGKYEKTNLDKEIRRNEYEDAKKATSTAKSNYDAQERNVSRKENEENVIEDTVESQEKNKEKAHDEKMARCVEVQTLLDAAAGAENERKHEAIQRQSNLDYEIEGENKKIEDRNSEKDENEKKLVTEEKALKPLDDSIALFEKQLEDLAAKQAEAEKEVEYDIDDIPNLFYEADFSLQRKIHEYTLEDGAEVLWNAPGGISRALKISASGGGAKLPVNVNPSKMPNCTLVVGVYLESIVNGSKGWILTSDDGGYDRSVVLHDSRFKGMGMATGLNRPVWNKNSNPKVKKWIHVVAVFREGKQCYFYVDGQQAPITPTCTNGEGKDFMYLGSHTNASYRNSHRCDGWVKEVKVYDRALDSTEVQALSAAFQKEVDESNNHYLVVAASQVVFDSKDLEECKKYLMDNYTHQGPSRMIAEVGTNGDIDADPYSVGGQNQGGGLKTGFNKWWRDWNDIEVMNAAATKWVEANRVKDTTTDQPSDGAISAELQTLLDRQETLKLELEQHSKNVVQLENEISSVESSIGEVDIEINAPPEKRIERLEKAKKDRDSACHNVKEVSAGQLEALMLTAGYDVLGSWCGKDSGELGDDEVEDSSTAMLRLLVADTKQLLKPTRIRTSRPTQSYEQLIGANISNDDVQATESIVQKLRKKVNFGDLDSIEQLVREEFAEDENVLPSRSLLVNSCDNPSSVNDDFILNPSNADCRRFLYSFKALYDDGDGGHNECVLLRSMSSTNQAPLERLVERLSTAGSSSAWALNACASFLLSSWLGHSNRMKVASIEELSGLITRLETMQANQEQAAIELDVFKDSTNADQNDTALSISCRIVKRLLSLREAAIGAESKVVSSSQMDIVVMVRKVRASFKKFSEALASCAVKQAQLEIQRRKTAILTGNYDDLGGSNVGKASSLDELIEAQEKELEARKEELEALKTEAEGIAARNEANANAWENYKIHLAEKIATIEMSIENRKEDLELATAEKELSEIEIRLRLEDVDKMRQELQVLRKQRDNAKEEADTARRAADKASQDLIEAERQLKEFELQKEATRSLINEKEEERSKLQRWKKFMSDFAKQLTETEHGILTRQDLASEYGRIKDESMDAFHTKMLEAIAKNFEMVESFPNEARHYKEGAEDTQKVDLRRALRQHLDEFPKIDFDKGGTASSSTIAVQGISLSYSEIEKALLDWVEKRCNAARLEFNANGILVVKTEIPSFDHSSIPEQVQKLFKDRIKLFHQPDAMTDGKGPNWDEFLKTNVKMALDHINDADYGISRWDVLREYARTIEVIVAKELILDSSVELPGMNFYVTAGKSIRIKADCKIVTTPPKTLQFKNSKAKDGKDIPSAHGGGSNGYRGQNGPAGKNAGHVTLRVLDGIISWPGELKIEAVGKKGVNGQSGGDGDKGREGANGKDADPADTTRFGGRQVNFAWARYPGCSPFDTLSSKPEHVAELSGNGGNGGINGTGGQGGQGGVITLLDERTINLITDSRFKIDAETGDGIDGIDGSYGDGGAGGTPGNKQLDQVRNQSSIFRGMGKGQGLIKRDYKEGLRGFSPRPSTLLAAGLNVYAGAALLAYDVARYNEEKKKEDKDWGQSLSLERCFWYNDFGSLGKGYPFVKNPTPQDYKHMESVGQNGKNGQQVERRSEENAHKQQEKRETNSNISTRETYQDQQYQSVNNLANDEVFAEVNKNYDAKEQELTQDINALQATLNATDERIDVAQKNLSQARQQSAQLSSKASELAKELEAISAATEKLQQDVTASDKETMSKILAGLEQSDEIKAIQLELSNLTIDSNYSAELGVKLQAVISTMEAQALSKQAELAKQQQELEKKISALTSELLRTQHMKSELANVNNVSDLNALLTRTQALSNKNISQQQQKQKSVQVEVDDEFGDGDANTRAILLSVRDTFVKGSAAGSVWRDLAGRPKAQEAVSAILASMQRIQEGKRALTLELLEVLTRYCIFNDKFEILETMLPLEDASKADEVVKKTFETTKEDLRIDHWFIGSMSGISILMSSSSIITVDEASLTCRYEQIDSMPTSTPLTKNERSATKFVRELETNGHTFQSLAQFLNQYTRAVNLANSLQGNGYLAVLQGKPVKFIDKFSRMILTALRRDDDALAMNNMQLTLGMAKLIKDTIETFDLLVHHNTLLRKRDLRGGGGYTRLFLENAEEAQKLLDRNKRESALAKLRSTGEQNEEPSVYGPTNFESLKKEIQKAQNATTASELTNYLVGVARSLSSGIFIEGKGQVYEVLESLQNAVFQNDDLTAVASGSQKSLATICMEILSKDLGGHDEQLTGCIRSSGLSRINVPSLSSNQTIQRVLSFSRQVESALGTDSTSKEELMTYLRDAPLAYAPFDEDSMRFLESLIGPSDGSTSYEDAVETVACGLFCVGLRENETQAEKEMLDKVAEATLETAGPIYDTLLSIAIQTRSVQVQQLIEEKLQYEVTWETLTEVGDMAHSRFQNFTSRDKALAEVDYIVSNFVFLIPPASLFSLWEHICASDTATADEKVVGRFVLAIIRGDDSGPKAYSQLSGASYLWRNWPFDASSVEIGDALALLHETTLASTKVVATSILSAPNAYPTSATSYLREMLEGIINILGKQLKPVPVNEAERRVIAVQLDFILGLSSFISECAEKKRECRRTVPREEIMSAYLEVDNLLSNWVLKLAAEFCKSEFDSEANVVAAAVKNVVDSFSLDSESSSTSQSLRADLAQCIRGGCNNRLQLALAQCLYITALSWSDQKHAVLFESDEAIDVALAMMVDWDHDVDKNDSRTCGLAILQTLVLETRVLEYNATNETYSLHSDFQNNLIQDAKNALPTRTSSTKGEAESPALVSENDRRVQFWKVCFSQLNDELLRNGPIFPLEVQREGCDKFESELVQRVNNALYARRKGEVNSVENLPEILVEGNPDKWAMENWTELDTALKIVAFEGLDKADKPGNLAIGSADFNAILRKVMTSIAEIQFLVKVDDSQTEQTTLEQADAIGWLLEKFSEAYGGMYMVGNDNDLESTLARTVASLSKFSANHNTSAKLKAAANRLSGVVERFNPKLSRYSQVAEIEEETFRASELQYRLSIIDAKCERASNIISRATTATTVLEFDTNLLFEFAVALQIEKGFASIVEDFEQKINDAVKPSSEAINTKEQAIKRLLAADADTLAGKEILSFEEINSFSELLSEESDYVQGLLEVALSTAFERLGGRLHFVLGMARESIYNPASNATDQKAKTKMDYNDASKMGSDRAYNNMLCNSFREAREQQMSFDIAREQVISAFKELARTDEKAAKNVQFLKEGQKPTQKYGLFEPPNDANIGNDSTEFNHLETVTQKFISMLERVLEACSVQGQMPTLLLIFGERVDELNRKLGSDQLLISDISRTLSDFTDSTVELIRQSAPLQPSLESLFFNFYRGTNLASMNEWCKLVLILPRIDSNVLFQSEGDTILYQDIVLNNTDGVNFVIDLLPKVAKERSSILDLSDPSEEMEDRLYRKALLKRYFAVIEADLIAYRDENDREKLECAQMMADAIMFGEDNFLEAASINFDVLFTAQEKMLADIVGSETIVRHALHIESTKKLISPTLWRDALSRLVLTYLLENSGKLELEALLEDLKESFWSPSIPREDQKPLQRALNEVEKVEKAMTEIFDLKNADKIAFCGQRYQNIFNATHYILYLTTAQYITDVRCPVPDERMQNEAQNRPRVGEERISASQLQEEWKIRRDAVEAESRQMVKKIKPIAEKVQDGFGVLKKVHERLVAIDALFRQDAPAAYKLVQSLVQLRRKSTTTIDSVLWLLQTEDPMVAKSRVDDALMFDEDHPTLESVLHRAAFDMMEADIMKLTRDLDSSGNDARASVVALRQQDLDSEGGKRLAKLILETTSRMVHDDQQKSSKTSGQKEQVQALLDSLRLIVEAQAWLSDPLLLKLESFVLPSRWLSELIKYSIAISLSYNPKSTNKTDEELFMNAAASIIRLDRRRGPLVKQQFLECLQILVKNHADAKTLATVAAKVASFQWDFSTEIMGDYRVAASKPSGSEMVNYLDSQVKDRRKNSSVRTDTKLTGIMREEIQGVNASISHFLNVNEGKKICELERRVQNTKVIGGMVDQISGKKIKDWSKEDIVNWSRTNKKLFKRYFAESEENTEKLDLLIAVFNQVNCLIKERDLRNPQRLAIIIFMDGMIKGKGLLGEIGTGEGKTVIAILSTAARIFKGDSVDVISSSPVLAKRDSEEAKEWFEYFDVGVSCNCDDEAEKDPDVREKRYRENKIIYGNAGSFQRDILLSKYYNKNIRTKVADSLVVDEVDSLLIDNVANTLYISHEIQDLKLLSDIFVTIWLGVHGSDALDYTETSVVLVKRLLFKKIEEGKLIIPNWLNDFILGRIDTWIRNAYKAKSMREGDQYILFESGPRRGQVSVVDLYTGVEMPNTKWSNGLHQFISLKHNNKLSAESLKAIFIANVNFVKMYGTNILGMTGTMGATAELDLIKNVYNVEAFRMPRFMEERYFEDSAIVVSNRARWIELLAEHVEREESNTELFSHEEAIEEAAKQRKKLVKAQGKLKKNQNDVTRRKGHVEQVKGIEAELELLTREFSNPADLDRRALTSIEDIVKEDLESSHFMEKDKEDYNNEVKTSLVDPLVTAVDDLKSNLQAIDEKTENSSALSKRIDEIMNDQRSISLTNPSKMSNSNGELKSKRDEKAQVDNEIERLGGESKEKSVIVYQRLKEMQQGLSSRFAKYLEYVEGKIMNDGKKVAEYSAEVDDRKRRLESAETAAQEGAGGRAVLVICRNKNDADSVAQALSARKNLRKLYLYTGTTDKITELDPKNGSTKETHVSLPRLHPHDVIVATNIAGRGTSFKTSKILRRCGGLHVVLAYVPSNIRVEVQAWGRTSRRGENGSGKFIVYDSRVSTSQESVDIDYLLTERDLLEIDRLEKIQAETIPRVMMENTLFDQFGKFSDQISQKFSTNAPTTLQQKELRDQWAYFLEEQDDELGDFFKNEEESRSKLLSEFRKFKSLQEQSVDDGEFGLVISPGNALRVVHDALIKKNYSHAKSAAQMIIDQDPQFAAYGYYYHALARFGQGTSDTKTHEQAMRDLEKAIFLLNRQKDQLQTQNQVVASVNGVMKNKGIGINSDYFGKSNTNTMSFIALHISAAERACGRALTEKDFNTSAINESAKKVYNIVNDKEELREKFLRPLRVSDRADIRLRVVAEDRSKVLFLTAARRNDENMAKWDDKTDTLEVCDVRDDELEKVKGLGFPWELALYIVGNAIDISKETRVTFPPSFLNAAPEILEALRKLAQNQNGDPIKFKDLTDAQRADIDGLFFRFLLTQEDIKMGVDAITDGDAQNHLVLDAEYLDKSLGKWDGVGFCGIGKDIKKWLLNQAAPGKAILESAITTEAKRLLETGDKQESDSSNVLEAIYGQQMGERKSLKVVKGEKASMITDDSSVIAIKSGTNITEKLEKVSFEGLDILDKYSDSIIKKLKNHVGKELKIEDFSDVFTGPGAEDDRADFVSGTAFLVLQALLREHDIGKCLCERLGVESLEKRKRDSLDNILGEIAETVDQEEMSKISFSDELQGTLINQSVLDMPRVKIGIRDDKKDIESLQKEIKKHLKSEIDKLADEIVEEGEDAKEKKGAMLDDVFSTLKSTITELVEMKPKIGVDHKLLADLITNEGVPPEFLEFVAAGTDIAFKVAKKKTWSDYWDWGAFAVAMIGIVQIAVGAAIIVLSAGTLTTVGGALISEGVGDVMYATVAGLTGTFSWKEYGVQKAVSLSVTATTGLLTGGVGTVALRASQIAAMSTKAVTMVVVKAVAKQIAKEVLEQAAEMATDWAVERLAEAVTHDIFIVFKDNFRGWVLADPFNQAELEKIKTRFSWLMDQYGEDQATKYIKDAISDSGMVKYISEIEGEVTGALIEVADNVDSELSDAGDRVNSGKGSKSFGTYATIVKLVSNSLSIANTLQDIPRYVPAMYKALNRRLLGIKPNPNADGVKDKLTGDEKTKWLQKRMGETSDAVIAKVEAFVQENITGAAFGEVVSRGADKLYGKSIDGLGDDMEALKNRVRTSNEIDELHSRGGELSDEERKQLVELQKELREDANEYPSAYENVDPKTLPDLEVRYNGEVVKLSSVAEKIGNNGLSVLKPISGKGEPILVRPKYEDYIEGLTVDRPANLVDLKAMAQAAGVNVTVQTEENGIKALKPDNDETGDSVIVDSVNIVFQRSHKYPEGRYVLQGKDGTIKYKDEFEDIGSASAAQLIVYQKAIKSNLGHDEAMKKANSRDEIEAFLKETQKTALNSAADEKLGTRYMYEAAEYEAEKIVKLPLVPNPRVVMTLTKFLRPRPKKKKLPTALQMELEIKVKSKSLRKTTKEDVDTSTNGPNKSRILVRALGAVNRLSKSAKVTAKNDGGEDGKGDIHVQMSKENLPDIVDKVSSTGEINPQEAPTLNPNATAKLKRVAMVAGVSVTSLKRHFKLEESKGKTNRNEEADAKTKQNESENRSEEVSLLNFTTSGRSESEIKTRDSNWGSKPVRRLLINDSDWIGKDYRSVLRPAKSRTPDKSVPKGKEHEAHLFEASERERKLAERMERLEKETERLEKERRERAIKEHQELLERQRQ